MPNLPLIFSDFLNSQHFPVHFQGKWLPCI